jgi:hypothetical protein
LAAALIGSCLLSPSSLLFLFCRCSQIAGQWRKNTWAEEWNVLALGKSVRDGRPLSSFVAQFSHEHLFQFRFVILISLVLSSILLAALEILEKIRGSLCVLSAFWITAGLGWARLNPQWRSRHDFVRLLAVRKVSLLATTRPEEVKDSRKVQLARASEIF